MKRSCICRLVGGRICGVDEQWRQIDRLILEGREVHAVREIRAGMAGSLPEAYELFYQRAIALRDAEATDVPETSDE